MSAYEGVGHIDVVDMLEQAGLENVSPIGRGEVQYSCPLTGGHAFGDIHPSAHMNQESCLWRCKGCGRAGAALELICIALKLTPVEGLRWLREHFGDVYRPPVGGSIAAEMEALQSKRETRDKIAIARAPAEDETIGPQGIFTIDWGSDHEAAVYMRARGFKPETLRRWFFGYDSWTHRVTFPIHDAEGRLVGFKGRALDSNAPARYMLLGDTEDRQLRYGTGYGFDMYDPTSVVFGLHRAVKSALYLERRRLIVCEGEWNAVALEEAELDNSVAIGTTTMTLEQQRLLRWYADEIVLFYDTDPAGHASTWGFFDGKERWYPGVVEKLSLYQRILVVPDHEGDPASMAPEQRVALVESAQSWLDLAVA